MFVLTTSRHQNHARTCRHPHPLATSAVLKPTSHSATAERTVNELLSLCAQLQEYQDAETQTKSRQSPNTGAFRDITSFALFRSLKARNHHQSAFNPDLPRIQHNSAPTQRMQRLELLHVAAQPETDRLEYASY